MKSEQEVADFMCTIGLSPVTNLKMCGFSIAFHKGLIGHLIGLTTSAFGMALECKDI